jgi:hypothetical protein
MLVTGLQRHLPLNCDQLGALLRAQAFRGIAILILVGFGANAWADGDNGYLRVVGPPSLRFRPPALDQTAVNPLLAINPGVSGLSSTNGGADQTASATSKAVLVGPEVPATKAPAIEPATKASDSVPAVDSTATSTAKVEPQQQSAPVQTVMPQPQMFLQYFTPEYLPGGNGYSIGLPVSFLPPQTSRAASSSATYQTTPPEKP